MAPMALLSHHVPFICEEANRTQGKQRPLGIHGYGRPLLCSGGSRALARQLELALAVAEAGRDTIAGRSDRFEPPCARRMHETDILSASCQLGIPFCLPTFPSPPSLPAFRQHHPSSPRSVGIAP